MKSYVIKCKKSVKIVFLSCICFIETETIESDTSSNQPNKTGKPQTVVCYICGREFGTKSIEYALN